MASCALPRAQDVPVAQRRGRSHELAGCRGVTRARPRCGCLMSRKVDVAHPHACGEMARTSPARAGSARYHFRHRRGQLDRHSACVVAYGCIPVRGGPPCAPRSAAASKNATGREKSRIRAVRYANRLRCQRLQRRRRPRQRRRCSRPRTGCRYRTRPHNRSGDYRRSCRSRRGTAASSSRRWLHLRRRYSSNPR